MKFTNSLGLPESVVSLHKTLIEDYSPGLSDYTPSSLAKPPYMAKLFKKYKDVLVRDVADDFFIIMGQLLHKALENSNSGDVQEERIYKKVGKWLIGMKFDNFSLKNNILQDFKYTSVYKFKRDTEGRYGDSTEWARQLNIGAYILRNSPLLEREGKLVSWESVHGPTAKVTGLQIVGFLRDYH